MTGTKIPETIRLGEQIKNLRKARFWNQEDMGKEAGINASQVSKVEQGHPCTLRTLTKMLNALGYEMVITLTPSVGQEGDL